MLTIVMTVAITDSCLLCRRNKNHVHIVLFKMVSDFIHPDVADTNALGRVDEVRCFFNLADISPDW